jgi:hypothetical protein
MGTYYTDGASRRDIIDQIKREYNVTRCALVGNTMHGVCELRTGPNKGQKNLVVFLLKNHSSGWGYKPVDESMGPVSTHCTCPPALIDDASPLSIYDDWGGSAKEWAQEYREASVRYWERRAAKQRAKNDRPESGKTYRLTSGPGEPSIAQGNTWAESEVR